MNRRRKPHKNKEFEEQVVQKFPYGCPYCDRPVSYDQFELKAGENEIQCLSCKKTYMRVISDSARDNLVRNTPLPRRDGRKGKGK
jgi:biotin synthase-related radical SAM superfamily protein